MTITDASRALEPSTAKPLGWEGRTLQQMLAEQDRLLAETGHYWGLETLDLQRGDPIRYEKIFSRLRGGLVSARETALNISASPIVKEIGELSFKYDFFEGFFFRPWLAIGLGISSINPSPAVRASASASGGVDLYITRDFFLTGELKGRVFNEGTEGPAHALAISDQKQVSLFAGMGFYFF